MASEDRQRMSVHLTARDMSRSVEFYRDQLGFEIKESWPNDDSPMWCSMLLGAQSVMLSASLPPDQVEVMFENDPGEAEAWKREADDFQQHKPGVGVRVYLMVDDIDQYAATVRDRGIELRREPQDQFYGIRDLPIEDPDGYQLMFFTPVMIDRCQSCGVPISDSVEGQMYCSHCTDGAGKLRSFDEVFEGTVVGYFMGVQSLERDAAEAAAHEHLKKMPAWASRE